MKEVTQTLPVATYLHTINPKKHSPFCTQCDQGGSQKESLSHFLSTCPKFHHARTAAHNQVCKVLAASLQKHLAAHWSLHRETPLSKTGLVSELVPTSIVLQSGRQVSDPDTTALQMLGRWQPDFMAISYPNKKIAIGQEECKLSDTRAENLFEAYIRTCTNSASKIHCLRMDSPGPPMGRGHSGICA